MSCLAILSIAFLHAHAAPVPKIDENTLVEASDGAQSAAFSEALGSAGDVNGDGFDDILVGARNDQGAGWLAGAVYLYLGSAQGVDLRTEQKIVPPALAPTWSTNLGRAVSSAGDVNGDGYDDVIVGATGAAFVYLGGPSGLDLATELQLTGTMTLNYGGTVSGVGDVNSDGYDDVVVSDEGDHTLGWWAGAVYLYFGSATGIDPNSEQKLLAPDGTLWDYFGASVSNAADVNCDGYADIVVGAHEHTWAGENPGAVYVFYGTPRGVAPNGYTKLTHPHSYLFDQFGRTVSAGDFDGDGCDDIAVGGGFSNILTTHVFRGGPAGADPSSGFRVQDPTGAQGVWWAFAEAAGDVDGDGYDDLILGARDDYSGPFSGSAYVLYGDQDALESPRALRLVPSNGTPYSDFGFEVSTAGDVDGDGTDDVLVSADFTTYADGGDWVGQAYVYSCTTVWYADRDHDTHGDIDMPATGCDAPRGYVTTADDCDDSDAGSFPGAYDTANDGIDQDCDGEDETCVGFFCLGDFGFGDMRFHL